MRNARLLGVSPMKSKIQHWLDRAFYFQGKAQGEKAAELFQKILGIDPSQPEALYSLGVLAQENGQPEEAIQLIAQSLQVDSRNVTALNALAGVLKDQGRFPEALEFYQAAVEIAPNAAYLQSNLGLLLNEMGRTEEALVCYHRALEIDPSWYAAHSNLGGLFQRRGEWQKALDCYGRALAVHPESSVVLTNMGAILNDLGRFAEALPYHEAALKIEPGLECAHINHGAALQQLGRVTEAMDCYWSALSLNPRSYLALSNLGGALWEQHQGNQAVVCLRKALELKPDCFKTLNSLGAVLKELGFVEEGLACLNKALECQPDPRILPQIYRNIGAALFVAGRAGESVDWFRKALKLTPDSACTFSDLLLVLNHLPSGDLVAEHLRFGERFDRLRDLNPHTNSPDQDRRLRIGFVSGDLRSHAVAYLIEPVFIHYDRSQFEIFCYATHPVDDPVSERLRARVDAWSNVHALSDDALAGRIRVDGIDILVDLAGHTAMNRLLVFARKPAPIQLSMIGYPQTTGLAAMDYRVTDEYRDPIGQEDGLCEPLEKLIRLPAGAEPFLAPGDCPPVNELPALKNGFITFANFNKPSKITPETYQAWAQVLKAVPGARFLIAGTSCDRVAATLVGHGIEPGRFELHEREPASDYFALYGRVDFVLDTFPYNGCTTSMTSLWMGVPFVSIQGNSTISRVGAGLLNRVGLSELIASDSEDYVQKAVSAVQDLPRLVEWRGLLRGRMADWHGDGSEYTRQLEAAFRQIWRKWLKAEG